MGDKSRGKEPRHPKKTAKPRRRGLRPHEQRALALAATQPRW